MHRYLPIYVDDVTLSSPEPPQAPQAASKPLRVKKGNIKTVKGIGILLVLLEHALRTFKCPISKNFCSTGLGVVTVCLALDHSAHLVGKNRFCILARMWWGLSLRPWLVFLVAERRTFSSPLPCLVALQILRYTFGFSKLLAAVPGCLYLLYYREYMATLYLAGCLLFYAKKRPKIGPLVTSISMTTFATVFYLSVIGIENRCLQLAFCCSGAVSLLGTIRRVGILSSIGKKGFLAILFLRLLEVRLQQCSSKNTAILLYVLAVLGLAT